MIEPIFYAYCAYLKEHGEIDFNDMINDSARILKEMKDNKQELKYKYIIIDEYQDISRQRFNLISALKDVCKAKIIAVGDDWQSIYAFSGSDITLFTKFSELVGYAKLLKIVKTYRNSQEVIDIAGQFIQKNKTQLTKRLISPKHINDPVIIYTYDGTYKKDKLKSIVKFSKECQDYSLLETKYTYVDVDGFRPLSLLGQEDFMKKIVTDPK